MFSRSTKRSTQRTEEVSGNEQPIASGIPLKVEGVSKTFPGRTGVVEALRPVNVDIAAGEFVCLLGPSGCGKSTLLSIIAGLEPASSGAIWADGQPVSGTGIDRVLLFSPRPGQIVREFRIDLPRPRSLDNRTVVEQAAEITSVLRQELDTNMPEEAYGKSR